MVWSCELADTSAIVIVNASPRVSLSSCAARRHPQFHLFCCCYCSCCCGGCERARKKTVERTWHAMKPRLICLRKCTFLSNSRLYSVAVVFFLFSCKYQTRWDLAIPFEKMSCMFLAFANWILGFRRFFFCCYCCECRGSDSQFVRCDWECAHAVIHKIQSGTFDGHRCQFM